MSEQLSLKLRSYVSSENGGRRLLHWCPGCDQPHSIDVEKPNHCGALWTWDGNAETPTVSPSVNYPGYCHYFLRGGNIEFCADSRHELAGKTVPLPAFPPINYGFKAD